ncbi:MAG: helix-turn-helix domain-containing protein [Pirellulaceae bacterium]
MFSYDSPAPNLGVELAKLQHQVAQNHADYLRILSEVRETSERQQQELASINEHLAGRTKAVLTVKEVAVEMNRCEDTVRNLIKSGVLPASRVPGSGPRGRLLIRREDFDRMVAAGRAGDLPPAVSD